MFMNGRTIEDLAAEIIDEDQNERLIPVRTYNLDPWMYDKVCSLVYLIRYGTTDGDTAFDIAFGSSLDRAIQYGGSVVMQLMIVRLRSIDHTEPCGWVLSSEEYDRERHSYTLMDMFAKVLHLETKTVKTISIDTLKSFPDEYELIDINYVVRSKGYEGFVEE